MKSVKEMEIEGMRKFLLEQAEIWREEGSGKMFKKLKKKAEGSDEDLMEEVMVFLAGSHYEDGFSSWMGPKGIGPYAELMVLEEIEEFDPSCGKSIHYLWTPISHPDAPNQEGVFVARGWDNNRKKEIPGTRFHHEDLDIVVAATVSDVLNLKG